MKRLVPKKVSEDFTENTPEVVEETTGEPEELLNDQVNQSED